MNFQNVAFLAACSTKPNKRIFSHAKLSFGNLNRRFRSSQCKNLNNALAFIITLIQTMSMLFPEMEYCVSFFLTYLRDCVPRRGNSFIYSTIVILLCELFSDSVNASMHGILIISRTESQLLCDLCQYV